MLQVQSCWPWQKDQSPDVPQVGSRKPTRRGVGLLPYAMHLGPSLKWLATAWQTHVHTSVVSTTWLTDWHSGTRLDITDHANTHCKARETTNQFMRHVTMIESGLLKRNTQNPTAIPPARMRLRGSHKHALGKACGALSRLPRKPRRGGNPSTLPRNPMTLTKGGPQMHAPTLGNPWWQPRAQMCVRSTELAAPKAPAPRVLHSPDKQRSTSVPVVRATTQIFLFGPPRRDTQSTVTDRT